MDQVYSNRRVPRRFNTSLTRVSMSSTRINTSQCNSDTYQHESLRVQLESTQIKTNLTWINTSRKQVFIKKIRINDCMFLSCHEHVSEWIHFL